MEGGKELERKAEVFGALSSPTRLRILLYLSEREFSDVKTLCRRLKLAQSVASQHLRRLFYAGLVARTRVRNFSYYKLTTDGKKAVLMLEEE